MIRITTLLWIALLVVAGGTVMHVSYQVRRVERHIAELNRDTRQEQDAIRILGAEWDTLNDPHRIDDLAQRHLTLVPTPIARVVTLDAIPLKPSEDQLARMAAGKAKPGQGPAGASPAAKPDDRAKALVTAQKGGAATIPASTPDGVGLILARAEAHR
jgi:cell division protein FtsL